ncbi:MAG: glycosyltransferase family 39 protein [Acidobacteria bacterium]|nr:glycosyltransferase family 39 protein [Acidobacteriota bacterium]
MRSRIALALVFLCMLPFFHIGRRVLWPPDEGRYAVMTREMVASRDYVVPTYAGVPNIDKPPLFVWAGAEVSRLFGGVSETAVRIPSAVAAVILLLSTFVIGARLFDPVTGALGAAILGTCGRVLLYSQWCTTDMLLSSMIALALSMAVLGRVTPCESDAKPTLAAGGIAFMAACALAVLTKGPVGVVVPVAVIGADLALACRRGLRGLIPAALRVARPWAIGGVVFFAIVAPWFILLKARLGAHGLREILFHQNVSRFLDAWNGQQPWYFYFEALPLDFLPWTLFLIPAALPVARLDADHAAAWRLLRTWFAVIFVFFSAASGKSPEYLMPLLPAAALLVARVIVLASGRGGAPAAASWLSHRLRDLAILLALAAAGGVGFLLVARRDVLPGAGTAVMVAAGLVLAGAATCAAGMARGRPIAGAAALVIAVAVVRLGPGPSLMDAGNRLNIAPQVGHELSRYLRPGARVGVGRKGADYILYYADVPVTPLDRPSRVESFLREGPDNAVVLRAREYRDLVDRIGSISRVTARFGDDSSGYVLVTATGAGG